MSERFDFFILDRSEILRFFDEISIHTFLIYTRIFIIKFYFPDVLTGQFLFILK